MRLPVWVLLPLAMAAAAANTYVQSIEDWRKARAERLVAPDGWTTLAGFFWLNEGENTVGSAAESAVVLPAHAPAKLGRFVVRRDSVRFIATPGTSVMFGSAALREREMKPNVDVFHFGDFSLQVLARNDRFALRLKDRNSKYRTGFKGLNWYPVNPAYRVTAKWIPYSPARKLAVPNVMGYTEYLDCPGRAEFNLKGRTMSLEPVLEGDQYQFIFRDLTTGKATYPGGRYIYTDFARDGTVEIDFNKAYTPPCAFTPYATCPRPPKENALPVAIDAGEKTYHSVEP